MNQINSYNINQTDERVSLIYNEIEIAEVSLKKWETDNFGKIVASLNIKYEYFHNIPYKQTCQILNELLILSHRKFELIELHIEISQYKLISAIEQLGFRLVDSRIKFITLIKKNEIKFNPNPTGEIIFANKSDMQPIIDLTTLSFINNPDFYSRFKNRTYFTEKQSQDYYSAWITNYIENPDAYFAVMKETGKVIGFFLYKKEDLYQGLPLYRGILTAVDPDYRGNNLHLYMQSFLYEHFPEDAFYLDNTTQLTNKPTITNHFKSGKRLKSVELTFYRTSRQNGDE